MTPSARALALAALFACGTAHAGELSVFHPYPGDLIRSSDHNHVTVDGASYVSVMICAAGENTCIECPDVPLAQVDGRLIATCPPVPEGEYRIDVFANTGNLSLQVFAQPDGPSWRKRHAKADVLWKKRQALVRGD